MVVRRFNESDVDFEAIDAELAKLTPPKLSLKEVLDRLRERMLEQRSRGVTVAQMHEVLKERGIELGERSLKVFLDKGELPGRKAAKVAAQIGGTDSEGDAF
jgi:transposase